MIYANEKLENCKLIVDNVYCIKKTAQGVWSFYEMVGKKEKNIGEIKLAIGGVISILFLQPRKKFTVRRIGTFNSRFTLSNNKEEEIMSLIPNINWMKKEYEIVVQPNMDCIKHSTPFHILLATHCTISYLNMLNGTQPALINI